MTPEFERFKTLLAKLLSVPRDAIELKIKEHRERTANNPNRTGPKRRHERISQDTK